MEQTELMKTSRRVRCGRSGCLRDLNSNLSMDLSPHARYSQSSNPASVPFIHSLRPSDHRVYEGCWVAASPSPRPLCHAYVARTCHEVHELPRGPEAVFLDAPPCGVGIHLDIALLIIWPNGIWEFCNVPRLFPKTRELTYDNEDNLKTVHVRQPSSKEGSCFNIL